MSKYAPPVDGKKPYIVTVQRWARRTDELIYAEDAASAKYMAVGRRKPMEYVVSCRRALADEVTP